jgi:hypothetical protein
MKRIYLTTLLVGGVIATGAYASQDASAKKVKIERGYKFGGLADNNESSLKKKSERELLAELVKLNRAQLKEQKRIREILENEFDPQPKMITLKDGTKCIENSSAKCFKMPMIPEVRKIPAIANAYKNPTLKNIKTRELWYAKYTDAVLNDAYLKGQAIRELGPKYPLATRPRGTIQTNGMDSVIMKHYKKQLVAKHMKNFRLNIFLGMNESLDMYSLVRLAYILKDNPTWKVTLVFNSNEAKKHWEAQYKNFYASKYFSRAKTVVQPSAFKEFKIYTTPSIYLQDLKHKKDVFIYKGRATEGDIISRVLEYMINNKYIKRNELSAEKAWSAKSSAPFIENYYKKDIGINYEK